MPDTSLLVGDIGGTNARFALARTDRRGFTDERTFECARHESVEAAIRTYLGQVGAPTPGVICLAAAGPVSDGAVRFTNNPWHVQTAQLGAAFATPRVHLINDFEAVAWALPQLDATHCLPIGAPRLDIDNGDCTLGVLGPGTGLGAAGLIRRGGMTAAIVGEGGHVGFAPETPLQRDVLARLCQRFERVSDERLVSGQGLENIHWALCRIDGVDEPDTTAADIFARADGGSDPRARAAVDLFFELLGQVAGNLALTLGAWHGIFLAGGIAQRYPERLAASAFRARFEAKGRHRHLMERVPTVLIRHPHPGLLGCSAVARTMADPSPS